MKTRKEFEKTEKQYYRPEFEVCQECGSKLRRSHTAWSKTIIGLSEVREVYNQAYRCEKREKCSQGEQVYRSVYADGLSMPYQTYGLDVVVYVGQARLRRYKSIPEIHRELSESRYEVPISERHVQNLFDVYLTLLACSHGKRIGKKRAEIKANGGIVLGVDGARPEKGQPGLYIFRDALTGTRLHAATLQSADSEALKRELKVVKGLGLPIQAVISDDEQAIVKAVADILPGVPHGLCHIHFLKAVQKPVYAQDKTLAKELRSHLRPLNSVERLLQSNPDLTKELSGAQRQALRRYLDSLRAMLLTKGQAPFRLAGISIFESLTLFTNSLTTSQASHSHAILTLLQEMTAVYEMQRPHYERVSRQQNWIMGLASLLDVPLSETHAWPTQTGSEVAQALFDYMKSLEELASHLAEDAPLFQHMRTRLNHWAPGLFWTYELPPLPRTNNDLEADIGALKEQYRRITGRRTLKDYLMRYGPFLAYDNDQDDPDELLAWFQEVDFSDFRKQRAILDSLRAQLRNIQRFRQDPAAFFAETERLWRNPD